MTSSIVRTNPTAGTATTASVRDNFGFAADEITALQRANVDIVSTTGGPVAYSASYPGSPTFSYSDGVRVIARINTTNTTTAPTLTISPVATAVPIKKADGSDVSIGDLVSGGTYEFVYNASSAEFDCLNLPGNTVTITGDQTITGSKTFSANTDFGAGIDVTGTVDCDGLKMDDGEYAQFGTGNDLQIFHNGTDSYIRDRGTGNLNIQTDGDRISIYDNANTRTMAQFNTDGAANLYWAGSSGQGLKLATTSAGIDVTGTVNANGVSLEAGDKLIFGAEADSSLQIYEDDDGGKSRIAQYGGGDLWIQGENISLRNDDAETLIGTGHTQAFMYWQGDTGTKGERLRTTDSGIDVTGGITSDYLDLTGGKSTTTTGAICADQIRFSAEGTDEAKIYASVDGVNTSLFIQSNDDSGDKVRVVAGGTEALTVSDSGIDVTGGITSDYLDLTGGESTTTTGTVACTKIKLADPSASQNDEHTIYTEASSVGSDVTNLVIHAGDDTHESVILRVGSSGGYIDPLKATGTGIDVTGDIEVTDNTKGVILKSPNGSRFRLEVANDGTLSTEAL